MIIWLASYPKSGNTWVRIFLETYFKKIEIDINIKGFPNPKRFEFLNIDPSKFENIVKNWKNLQHEQNLSHKYNILKTHNALCTINNYKFTSYENTFGAIYLVRDPRDVLISYASHLGISHKEALNVMMDTNAGEIKKHYGNLIQTSLMSSWSNHYNSWKSKIGKNDFLYLKYEEIIKDTYKEFSRIIKYLSQIYQFEINENKILEAIEETNFEKLREKEKMYGFEQATGNTPFFRKGVVGDWKNNVDKKIIKSIETFFSKEMKELNYL